MNVVKSALAICLSLFALPQAMACFTVYNASSNEVVYSGQEAPMDMSYQIHERLPAVFPGGHMVFGVSNDCPAIDARKLPLQATPVAAVSPALAARSAPRLTRAQRERAEDALTK